MEYGKLNARALLTAVAAIACAGCSSQDRPASPATRPVSDRRQTRAATQTAPSRSPPASRPAEPTTRPAVARLLPYLDDIDPNTRLQAAVALGRLGEPEAMWPLIQTGANDPDPNVRLAAVEAVAWWGRDPVDSWETQWRRRFLDMRTPGQGMAGIDLRDWVQFLAEHTSTSYTINWRTLGELGIEPTTKVGRAQGTVPVAEALCRVLAGTGKPVGFTLSPRLCISSTQDLAAAIRGGRRDRARAGAIRQWGEQTEAGRRMLEKLQRKIKSLSFADIDFKDVIQFFREYSGAQIRVDWRALRAGGNEPSTKVSADVHRATVERALQLVLQDVSGAAAGADAEPEYLVDDDVVIISTRKAVERRMAAGTRPIPRLVPTRQEEEKQAVARLIAALKHRDPLVRRSAAWALGKLQWLEAMWPLIQAAANDQDPNVRDAAAEAVTWLGMDPNSDRNRRIRARLLERIPRFQVENWDLRDAVYFIAQLCSLSCHATFRDASTMNAWQETKVTVQAENLTVAEAWCRALAATKVPIGFMIDPGDRPIFIASTRRLTGYIRAMRSCRRRMAALRAWGLRTPAGRRTMKELQTSIRLEQLDHAELADVIQYLRELTGVGFVVDWAALEAAGLEKSARVTLRWSPYAGMGWRPVLASGKQIYTVPTVEQGLWGILARADRETGINRALEYIVDDEVVFISTRAGIDRRMAAREREGKRDE